MDPNIEIVLAYAFIIGIVLAPELLVGILWITGAGSADEEYRLKVVSTVMLISALFVAYLGIWLGDAYLTWLRALTGIYPEFS